jgi:hypothetical protein
VVEGVPAQIVLRSGKEVATLTNIGMMPPPPGKGRRAARAAEGS